MTERLSLNLSRLALIPAEETVKEPFRDFFRKTALFLLSVSSTADNTSLYADILPGHYAASYANPDYAASCLGEEYGPLFSAVLAELRGYIPAVFEGLIEEQCALIELFLLLYFEFEGEDIPAPGTVRGIFCSYLSDYLPLYASTRVRNQLDPASSFALDIIRRADFSGTDYLYEYGEYVSENTIRTARFIHSLDEETISLMAETFANGYRNGFLHAGKDLTKKKTVQIVYELGFERMIRASLPLFQDMGLVPTIVRSSVHLVTNTPNRHNGYTGAIPNRQFDYDHRDDLAVILDGEFASLRKRVHQEAFASYKEMAGRHAGPAVLETFGSKAFEPAVCHHALRFTPSQEKLLVTLRQDMNRITQRYIPQTERSFTIIAFPVPEIGEPFEDIFRETVRVNTLDSEQYSRIQEKLISALDQGTKVRIKGRGGNNTDLTIALPPLPDPLHKTLFENCVADVNIPVGEVFTTPRLKGTEGLLHVGRVFLSGMEFRNLRIYLKDGMIEDYNCGNFASPEENRKYIEDNILFRHPSLAIGEFAIGTNTAAYRMGRKFGIEQKLPILIAEKTGPHFAMGDTCYMGEEDNPVFNPDGREMTARDNEHSLLRLTDPAKAYYGCHTDITIPFDELDSIRVIKEDGSEISLIDGGRFVLPGTEALNIPLDEMHEL